MFNQRFLVLTSLIILTALSRLVPHPPNFAPIGALALFGGAYFTDRKYAFVVPLLALFISDLFIGLHNLMFFVYGGFALIVLIGFKLRSNKKIIPIALSALAASFVFFIVSNFGVWAIGSFYSKNFTGLIECYVAAIPFIHNTFAGDLFYTTVLFGGFKLAQTKFSVIREEKIQA